MTNVGGQAVLEGVMMRGPSNWAVAVRKPDGQIAEVCRPIESVMKRHWLCRLPVIRGVLALIFYARREPPAFSSRFWKRSTRPPLSISFCLPV